ncbi:hypothetical protein ACH4E8_08595 [Streptomyces sp. NPDC017979]|uniref:hypothetical protein n=1 Tax=Streptomyces sp. NPDC017979 TaxID=3365024 RepID=UPI0037B77D1E
MACYGPYDDSPEGTGLVLSITDYDGFTTACPRAAQIVLDIVADQARHAGVLQRRFFCLILSNDPDIQFEPVGAMPVLWNDDEWFDADRRPPTADRRPPTADAEAGGRGHVRAYG